MIAEEIIVVEMVVVEETANRQGNIINAKKNQQTKAVTVCLANIWYTVCKGHLNMGRSPVGM